MTKLLLPAVLLVAGYYVVFGGEHSLLDVRRARVELAAAAVELDRLRVANDSLRALVDSLETDPAMLERLARERFGLIRVVASRIVVWRCLFRHLPSGPPYTYADYRRCDQNYRA